MNEVIFGLVIVGIVAMIVYDKMDSIKRNKAYAAAQKVINDQIAALEAKLASLKK